MKKQLALHNLGKLLSAMLQKYLKGQTGMKDISIPTEITKGRQTNLVIVPMNLLCKTSPFHHNAAVHMETANVKCINSRSVSSPAQPSQAHRRNVVWSVSRIHFCGNTPVRAAMKGPVENNCY